MVNGNILKNPITAKDTKSIDTIFGPYTVYLNGKTARKEREKIKTDYIQVLRKIMYINK